MVTFGDHDGVMAYLPSLSGDAVLLDVFRAYPVDGGWAVEPSYP